MFKLLRRLLLLPEEVAVLRKEFQIHTAAKTAEAHNYPFWVSYYRRQLTIMDQCSQCGYTWPKSGPEQHFNDTASGEHCPLHKEITK